MSSKPEDNLDLTGAQKASIDHLMKGGETIQPPEALARAMTVDFEAEQALASGDPRVFWARKAAALEWHTPWDRVLDWNPPHHRWFAGGRLNATVNCLDRHVHGERRLKAALIWVGENGEEHIYTYNRLYREVNRFGNALRRLGVGKGDRVIVYMPLVPEGVVASLKDHVREDLGPIAQPSEIELRDSLPKTRSGKIVRRLLRAQALGEDPGDLSTLAD